MERRNKKYILFILLLALTLLVVATGVLFTSRNFIAYCYNYDDESLSAKIIKTAQDGCENKSIFLIKEGELKRKIESKFANVEVISIERVFPDTVKVNYSVKKNYAYALTDGVYKYLSKDCKVLGSDGGEIARDNALIKIISPEDTLGGKYLFSTKGYTYEYVYNLLSLMEKMGFKRAEEMIEEIDLLRAQKDLVVIKWRSGASIHVEYPSINYFDKIRLAVSAITTCQESKRTSGVWRVYGDKIAYSAN